MSIYLCLFAFTLCYWAGRRSLVSGMVAVLGVGYLYGITRANVPETYSHFIFDAGVAGLYAAQLFSRLSPAEQYKISSLRPWLEFLIAWPLLLALIPIQDFLIQIVGLRGHIFLLPFILLGARLEPEQRYRLALWIAGLNVLAFAFAVAEYFMGIERFFPRTKVTELLYLSKDLAGHTAHRIPASFINAHAYGGTMTMCLPLLIGALVQKHKTDTQTQLLLVIGITTALLGLLMSGTRTHALIACLLLIVATFSLRSRFGYVLGWLILLCSIGWFVSGEQRLQRFTELRDTELIMMRLSWSVNENLFELAVQYPFGNGLGGGGTSIPYFLKERLSDPVLMENEYARIMLEQGIMGLVIWIMFILWLLTRKGVGSSDSWYLGRRLARVSCILYFAIGLTGLGLLTSIPQTSLFLILVGWVGARQSKPETAMAAPRYVNQANQTPAEATWLTGEHEARLIR